MASGNPYNDPDYIGQVKADAPVGAGSVLSITRSTRPPRDLGVTGGVVVPATVPGSSSGSSATGATGGNAAKSFNLVGLVVLGVLVLWWAN